MDWNRMLSSRQALALAAAAGALIVVGVWAADEPRRQEAPPKPEPPAKAAPPARESDFVRATRNAAGVEPATQRVITNEELAKVAGNVAAAKSEAKPAGTGAPATAQPAAEDAASAPDDDDVDSALEALERDRAEELRRAQLIEAAERDLEAARKKVADLEVQLLAARNPFAPRPDLSDEEKKKRAETNETPSERVERTQKMIEDARADVVKAEQKLAELRSGG